MQTKLCAASWDCFGAKILAMCGVAAALASVSVAHGQDTAASDASVAAPAAGGSSDADLAQQLSNPVANLISIPLQFNYDEGFGPENAGRYLLNIQPVVPFQLNDDWNLITRTIAPVIYQDSPASGIDSTFGLGDVVFSGFFSPAKSDPIWGVGPVFLLPTATDDSLGGEKWGAGLTGVILKQQGGWTYGGLVNHIWSYAGASDRAEVNASFLQPFVSYTTSSATTFALNTEATYDWNASQWIVPINLTVSQLTKLGNQPISIGVGGRYYVESPDGGPEWGLRFSLTILLPK